MTPDDAPAPYFTEGQRRLLAFTAVLFAFVASSALVIFLLAMVGRAIGFFSDVLWPVVVAGIIALILRPLVDRIEARIHGRRLVAVIVLYIAFLLAMAVVLVLLIPPLAAQVWDFFNSLPDLWQQGLDYVQTHYPEWKRTFDHFGKNSTVAGVVDATRDQAARIPGMLIPSLRVLKNGAWATVGFVTHLAVVPIYLFFFLLSRTAGDPTRHWSEHLPFVRPSLRDDIVFLAREFINIVISFFRGQLVIALVMGCLYAFGFTVIGLRFGLFIGLLIGMLNVIPYLGTIVGLATVLPLAALQAGGGLRLVILVLVVKVVIQAIEGWFLTPKIMGHRTGLHPAMIIFAILFWGTAFHGILGMILAIPLTAFFVTFWRLLKRKYFPAVQPV